MARYVQTCWLVLSLVTARCSASVQLTSKNVQIFISLLDSFFSVSVQDHLLDVQTEYGVYILSRITRVVP